jgi:molybdate transport system substrate-binding protein
MIKYYDANCCYISICIQHIMKNRTLYKKILLSITGFLLFSATAFAQNLKVAAAANLQGVIKVLQADFMKKTGIGIDPIIGSSGNLSTQIKNGAPFDVFLSADMAFPQALFAAGFTTAKPVVYAKGSLIICSIKNLGFENWERMLLTPAVKKVAIANPGIAPYGKAAVESLKLKGVLSEIKSKTVYGESIAQVNTYITAGVVDVGFTTQSFVKDEKGKQTLYWKAIDPKTYSPIEQGVVILKHAAGNADAVKFYQYILSADAKKIFKEYGYYVE